MRTFCAGAVLLLLVGSSARAECDWLERHWFSAAAPGYPAKEFWAPRIYRLHACHWPVSVSVYPPARCDVTPGFILAGPYCPGSQPHFPADSAAAPPSKAP